ncbi:CopY/TcrY family copper transport repressor [Xylocopilactobacillus apicola]|uniref:Transcriptional regulator n=1 Tax=Xylocopilactobacillus apicola TaxID=2932184 RepID=A0AAU9D6B8_9LACO|nr:CopY/TcrY family copper transport repressor [Xylocopilactobacillus apicola]BDR57845.1 transcriptional regulator [Xylocopilactobacillus apicola]
MKNKVSEDGISPAEWEVMRIIWTLGPVKTNTVIQVMNDKMNWQASTTKTFLARLKKKGFLTSKKEGREFCYQASIDENKAINEAVSRLFSNICEMCVGNTVNQLLENLELSRRDIEKMQDTLAEKLKTAPEKIDCNCLPDEYCHHC